MENKRIYACTLTREDAEGLMLGMQVKTSWNGEESVGIIDGLKWEPNGQVRVTLTYEF